MMVHTSHHRHHQLWRLNRDEPFIRSGPLKGKILLQAICSQNLLAQVTLQRSQTTAEGPAIPKRQRSWVNAIARIWDSKLSLLPLLVLRLCIACGNFKANFELASLAVSCCEFFEFPLEILSTILWTYVSEGDCEKTFHCSWLEAWRRWETLGDVGRRCRLPWRRCLWLGFWVHVRSEWSEMGECSRTCGPGFPRASQWVTTSDLKRECLKSLPKKRMPWKSA